MEKLSHRMDKNSKMRPRARNNFKKWDLESVGPPVNLCKMSSPRLEQKMFQKDLKIIGQLDKTTHTS